MLAIMPKFNFQSEVEVVSEVIIIIIITEIIIQLPYLKVTLSKT